MSEHIKRFLNIKAKTWLKDTHGLFDYEIMNESKVNNLTVSGSGY